MAVGHMLHRRCSVERVVEIALHRPARESQKVQMLPWCNLLWTLCNSNVNVHDLWRMLKGQKWSTSVVKPRQTELTLPSSLAVEVCAKSLRMLTRKAEIPCMGPNWNASCERDWQLRINRNRWQEWESSRSPPWTAGSWWGRGSTRPEQCQLVKRGLLGVPASWIDSG